MINGLPLTDEEQMQLALKWGGLEAWGTEMMYPHYSTAWAWTGNTPFRWGKQVASYKAQRKIRGPCLSVRPRITLASVISSSDSSVFAVAAAGVLYGFTYVMDALP